ncbi:alcohol dehydrogenase catalytic domain-containing protein [Novosphingobium sp. G106]|uniref:alcohol dehydrogenase catalytic domain-containing protein n=1 Tax=Novosphingobium sp. G106 TaxID=2849500 RepID=UPI001C2D7BDE|nr:alcohol dehydrogenase catalytic domain-containing protein [Novosphingobium sp. G106]MBV1686221.1 alcohol dehydrogenase catalytic domain-containing protein [Novosphingobium sp. G106]
MKAAVFKGPNRAQALQIETLQDPVPGPSDLLVKVGRCGICGTDLHMTSGHGWDFPVGSVLGHEFAGEVVAVGRDVERHRVGDRVSGMAKAGCGACEACFRGLPLFCPNGAMTLGGGFGEYVRIHDRAATRLPATLSLADGALVEPLAIGMHGVAMANMRLGARVLVIGAGSVGLATIFWARRLGAGRIVAASRSVARSPMALAMGADVFVQTGPDEVGEVIEALGNSPEIVFECVGALGLLEQSINHVAVFGQVVSLGFCTSPDAVVPATAAFKQVRISFPLTYSPEEFERVADIMLAGKVDPKMMITSEVSLDDLPATFEQLRSSNDQTKVHVVM